MKKLIATILTLALALTAILGLVSCKGSGDGEISVFYYTTQTPTFPLSVLPWTSCSIPPV